ncbi:FecR family protein [Saccharicrinis carchari]|uniref:FecR family protein n=1 Tax=Saccharicrinis carchari TaxID=1168039 RepID=A0A521B8M4_SACCC|nr:FecR domain-containing protein [Saccharicrinis carchari]SMO43080.1 FecR family protein [Saccharicrinis carchari]
MNQLIIRYLTNNISTEERKTLDAWKAMHPENKMEFEQLEQAWIKSECLKTFKQIDSSKDWHCIRGKLKPVNQKTQPVKRLSFTARKIAAITIPLIMMAALGFAYWNVPGFGRLSAHSTQNLIETLSLPDGSMVTLNRHSKIIYPSNIATAKNRRIALSGEAFFKVNHNNTPFVVNAGEALVQVMGTEFNVQQHMQDVSVSVISGKVKVSTNKVQVQLEKGERAQIKKGKMIQESAIAENDIYWFSKTLIFNGATLSHICKQLQQNFPQIKSVQFKAMDLNTKLSTTFKNQSLEEILEELEIHFDKKIVFDGITLTVSE